MPEEMGDGVKCPKCAHENRQSAKFCRECAAPLSRSYLC
ncbi:MAG: zinc-ribbon domain-containing protein [Planctomycetota bacterium]